MVKLSFEITKFISRKQGAPVFDVIRIIARAKFLQKNSKFSYFHKGVIDTDTYFTLIPRRIWKNLKIKIISEDESITGINPKSECRIPASLGIVTCILVNEEDNKTDELELIAYLAKIDQVLLLLGFANLLSKFTLHFNCEKKQSYINEN